MVQCTPARNERGQILILTALSMTILLGVAALSLDASLMYDKRNRLHAAADAAAKTAASEVHRKAPLAVATADLNTFAYRQVLLNGFPGALCGSTTPGTTSACINHPPMNGPFAGDPKYVEAIVSQVTSTFFGNIFGFPSLNPGARAVAGISPGPGCLVTLDPGAPGITVSNAAGSITAAACAILDGGDLNDSGTITAQSVGVTGACVGGCGGVTLNMPAPLDPLGTLPVPSAADCNNGNPGLDVAVVGPVSLSQGTYHDITFGGGALTLQPGLYCITGNITVTSPDKAVIWNDTGGVTIYFGSMASLNLNSNLVTITLEAQTFGVYKGIIFYQARGNDTPVRLSKDAGTLTVNGALYFPYAPVEMNNVSFATSNACGIMVAASVDMALSNMTLANQCASFGGSPILTVSVAE